MVITIVVSFDWDLGIFHVREGVGYARGVPKPQKTPEMNELEPDKIPLKIWVSNFEKQKR